MTNVKHGNVLIKVDLSPEELATLDESAHYYYGRRGRAELLRHIIADWNEFWRMRKDGTAKNVPPLPDWVKEK